MLAALVSNLVLWRVPVFHALAIAQLAFYAVALVGAFGVLPWKALRLPFYFCMINASLFVWMYNIVFRRNGTSSSARSQTGVVWT